MNNALKHLHSAVLKPSAAELGGIKFDHGLTIIGGPKAMNPDRMISVRRLAADAVKLARAYGPRAIECLMDIVESTTTPAQVRINAIAVMLQRGYGSPDTNIQLYQQTIIAASEVQSTGEAPQGSPLANLPVDQQVDYLRKMGRAMVEAGLVELPPAEPIRSVQENDSIEVESRNLETLPDTAPENGNRNGTATMKMS